MTIPGIEASSPSQPVVRLLQRDRDLRGPVAWIDFTRLNTSAVEPAELGVGVPVQAVDDVGGGDRVAVPELHPGLEGEHELWSVTGSTAWPGQGASEPSGACSSRDSHISETAVFSG